jgi:hypothetical protein
MERYTALKGTVPQDFLPLVFFIKLFLLGPLNLPRNDFNNLLIIRSNIRLFRCFAGVNNTGEACIAGVIDTGE